MRIRCGWAEGSLLEQEYHDTEWGVPLHEDRLLFEFLVLEAAQAGLSWATILRKRAGYQRAFDGFVPEIVDSYDQRKVEELLGLREIVRNRLKIKAAIRNAREFLRVRDEFGTFDTYIWGFGTWQTSTERMEEHFQRAGLDAGVRCHEQWPQEARFLLRGNQNLLCFYAGGWDGQRP